MFKVKMWIEMALNNINKPSMIHKILTYLHPESGRICKQVLPHFYTHI